jgi:1-acyl-sn-glycerol-3-phosphate acyltransferase
VGRNLLAALRTVIAVPTFFVFTLLVAAYAFVTVAFFPHSAHIEKVIRFWSRRFIGIAPVRFEVEGADRIDPSRTYVFVANHLSSFDIPILFLGVPVPIRYLAKKELFKIPILAQAMRKIGIIEIDRQAHGAAHALINHGVAKAVERGHSIIVFPEGHRTEDRELQAFKKGAFRIAIDNHLPLVPVTIHGTWDVWKPGARVIYPGRARMVIHDPIEVDGMTRADLDALIEQTRTVISDQYDRMRAPA